MKDHIKVYVERIRDGEVEELSEMLAPDFMDIHEQEMRFMDPVVLKGQAYVTDDWLIVSLHIQTAVQLVCSVCNEPFCYAIDIHDMVHDEPLENIRDGQFDILPLVRENILLEVPFYPQCGLTSCKKRSEIEPFLKQDKPPVEKAEEHGHNPFKDLF